MGLLGMDILHDSMLRDFEESRVYLTFSWVNLKSRIGNFKG